MKRITGIAIALTAFIGCSYVGTAGAASCQKIGETASAQFQSVSGVKGNKADMADNVRVLVEACKVGVNLREQGLDVTNVLHAGAQTLDEAAERTTDKTGLIGATTAVNMVAMGYAYGDK
ncbi:hypothetical protein [Hafnia phage TS33]|nr:hypothetical protein [Hafnia phage TS33]